VNPRIPLRRTRSRAAAVVALLLTALAALTACGSGSSPAGPDCPAAPGVTSDRVTFGLLFPSSGADAATFSPYRSGVDARLGVANAKGGVFGRQIDYVRGDDQGNAARNLAEATNLVTEQHVFAIQELSSASGGSAAWLHGQLIPVVGAGNDPVWNRYPNMFSYLNIFSDRGSVSTWGDYARKQGSQKVAVLSARDAASAALAREFQASMSSAGIAVAPLTVDPDTADLARLDQTIAATGADTVFSAFNPDQNTRVARGIRAALPAMRLMSVLGDDQSVLAAGRQLAGMSLFTSYRPFETPVPAHRPFLSAMALYAPEQKHAASEVALAGWVDTDLMLRGIQAAGRCPTRASFTRNLRVVPDYSADGLLPRPVDLRTVADKVTPCFYFLTISGDGKRLVPAGNSPLCGRSVG